MHLVHEDGYAPDIRRCDEIREEEKRRIKTSGSLQLNAFNEC